MSFNINKTSVFISPLFAILVSIILFVDTTGIMLFGFLSAFLHELGHIFCMAKMGKTIDKISLSPCGVLIITSGVSNYKSDLYIALAGPLVNLCLFALAVPFFLILKHQALLYFIASNFGLFLFNILPMQGLDGMDVIRSLLLKKHSFLKTDLICKIISFLFLLVCFVMSVIFVCFNKINPTLLVCLLYLLIVFLLNAKK